MTLIADERARRTMPLSDKARLPTPKSLSIVLPVQSGPNDVGTFLLLEHTVNEDLSFDWKEALGISD